MRDVIGRFAMVAMLSVVTACGDVAQAPGTGIPGDQVPACEGEACPPESLRYATSPARYTLGGTIAPNTPSHTGGRVSSYSVTPALPVGVVLDPATGVISGVPAMLADERVYTVEASNPYGAVSTDLAISVVDTAPTELSYSDPRAVYARGRAIPPSIPTVSGGPVTRFSIHPPLPPGLELSPTTGVLSGTPTAVASRATYTVTASNSGGEVETALDLAVFDFDAIPFLTLPQNLPGFAGLGSRNPSTARTLNGTLYVATSAGVSVSTDDGASFVTRTTYDGLANNGVNALAAVGDTLVIATENGVSWTTDGVSFTSVTELAGRQVLAIASDGTRVYVGDRDAYSGDDRIRVSADGGRTFPTTIWTGDLVRALSASPSRLCVATNTGGVLISTDGGQHFTTATTAQGLGSNNVYSVACPADSDLVAVGTSAGLSISTDGGASFVTRDASHGLCGYASGSPHVFADAGVIHVASFSGYSRSSDGVTFTCKSPMTGFRAIDVVASGDLVLVTHAGGLCRSTDGGDTFDCSMTSSQPSSLNFMSLLVQGQDIVVGGTSGSLRSSDGGATLSPLVGLPSGWVLAIARLGGTLVLGGLTLGAVISTDGGASFVQRTQVDGLPADHVSDVAVAPGRIYVTAGGGLGVSTNGGSSFVTRTLADGLPGTDVRALATSDAHLFVGSSTGLGVSSDGGDSFVTRTTHDGLASDECSAVHVAASGELFVGHTGQLSRSLDDGVTFTATELPTLTHVSIKAISTSDERIALTMSSVTAPIVVSLDGGRHFWPVRWIASGDVTEVVVDDGYLYVVTSTYRGPGGLYRSAIRLVP